MGTRVNGLARVIPTFKKENFNIFVNSQATVLQIVIVRILVNTTIMANIN